MKQRIVSVPQLRISVPRWVVAARAVVIVIVISASIPNPARALTEAKLLDPLGSATARFGHSVALSGNNAIVGARYDPTQGTDAGKAVIYEFDGLQWVAQAQLFPPALSDHSVFAQSVDISGDYAIVGTPYLGAYDASQTGTATIYFRTGSGWTQQAVLVGNDSVNGDRFGESVSIDGDYVLVGAPDHGDQGIDAGAAYVFLRSGTSWPQQAKLLASDGAANMGFGSTVALSGPRAIVRGDRENPKPGHIYAFERSGTLWTQQAKFNGNDTATGNKFGWDLALSGFTALTGAHFHLHPPAVGTGYAFDYNPATTSWTQKKEFIENSQITDLVGFSVGLDGDFAGLAAINADGNQPGSGVVYFYRRTFGGAWAKVAKVSASDTIETHSFGYSLDISGDCAIVGAIGDADVAPTAGAAYVFCELPIAIFQVEIDIICCIQIPEFGTGPVELVTRFTNLLDEPQLIEIWFQLVQPDGVVLDVSRRAEVEVDIGETLIVPLSIPLSGEGPIGDYTLLAYWMDAEGEHSNAVSFSVGDTSLPLPVPMMPGGALLALGGALVASAHFAIGRRRSRAGWCSR